MEEEQPGKIKIVDKRRFSESGDENPNVESIELKPTPIVQGSTDSKSDTKKGSEPRKQTPSTEEQDEIDFSSFIVSLATQSLVMLGEIPHPETRLSAVNIEAAKQTIDIIALIKDKTKGNLTKEEDNLIQEILTSLRLAFVNKVKP